MNYGLPYASTSSTTGWAGYFQGNVNIAGNAAISGTTTVNNISITGTCVGCSAGGAAAPTQSLQYNNGGNFGGATGLYYSTTRSGLDFLANVTTANLIALADERHGIKPASLSAPNLGGANINRYR